MSALEHGSVGAHRPSDEQFGAFLADAPIACHEIDLSGRIVRVNDAECRLLGVEPRQILGRPVWEFVAARDREESMAAVLAKLRGIQPLTCFEREYVLPNGATAILEIRESMIRDSRGQIAGIRSFLTDATSRRRAEQAREESERRLRHLVENATDIMYQADLRGRFTFVNPTAARILGFPVAKLVGMHYLELIRPDWRPKAHRFYRRQLLDELLNTYFEFPTLAADGREVWFGQNLQLTRERGRVSGFQAIARDITDRVRAEQELRRAQEELEQRVAERTAELAQVAESLRREVEERRRAEEERRHLEAQIHRAQRLESLAMLAGGVAHDFNNLLMTITGHASLALQEIPAGSSVAASLAEIQTAGDRAADLVQKMLAYSGRGRLVLEPVNLSELTREMQPALESMIAKHASLSLILEPRLPEIQADPAQIRQALTEVMLNASEALGNGCGTISISTGVTVANRDLLSQTSVPDLPEGSYVFMRISDTGCGMTHEAKAKVFDPFFSTKFAGRGLGMAAVLGIVHSHRGAIAVESEPGRGTTFRLLFPPTSQHIAYLHNSE